MLFYLRKLEGAEILLATETNVFRQDLHKWAPIAPEAPPMIDMSLSTRKPRPTKQQKIMKEMGIQKVEDLPAHLRTKSASKTRKNTDGSIGSNGQARPLQPQSAHMLQGQGIASASGSARSDTPSGMPRQASTGNAPNTNGGLPPYGHPLSIPTPDQPHFSTNSPSPMFSPATSLPSSGMGMRDPMVSGAFNRRTSAEASGLGLFNSSYNMGDDDDIRTGLANGPPNHNTSAMNINTGVDNMSSPQAVNVDDIFAEMTNQEDRDPGNMEPDASAANSALDMMGSDKGNDDEEDRNGDGDNPEGGHFDELFPENDGENNENEK